VRKFVLRAAAALVVVLVFQRACGSLRELPFVQRSEAMLCDVLTSDRDPIVIVNRHPPSAL